MLKMREEERERQWEVMELLLERIRRRRGTSVTVAAVLYHHTVE